MTTSGVAVSACSRDGRQKFFEEPARLPFRPVDPGSAGCNGQIEVEPAGQALGEHLRRRLEDHVRSESARTGTRHARC